MAIARGARQTTGVAGNSRWSEARQYVAWLAKTAGKPYRLLSESEYEYATRADATTAYPWGNDIGKNNANCYGCYSQWNSGKTAPVGSFAPNRFGLHDMVGNVPSWVEDCGHDNYKGVPTDGSAWLGDGNCSIHVARGGSPEDTPVKFRSAYRRWDATDQRWYYFSVRVARTLTTRADAGEVALGVR